MNIKELIESRTGLKLKELKPGSRHEIGKTYYNGYWQKTYTVLDYIENNGAWRGWAVFCQWEDGCTNSHCTSLDTKYDFEVITE